MTGKRYAGQAVKAVPVGTRGFAGNMKRRVGRDTKEKNHPTAVEVIVYHRTQPTWISARI